MLLAGHFGGVPRNPKLLVDDPKRQERILEASEDFAIGFLLIDQSKAKAFEDKFINCLAPLANTEVYSKFKKTPPYNIHKLILFWPDEIKKGCFEESPHKTLPDLEGLKKCHEEKLKDLN